MKNKNILELCLAHGLGGLEMYVSSCYAEFSKKTVCKVVVNPGSKLDNYLNVSDKLYIKRNKFFPFIPALQLANYIDKHEIDIIHFHWTKDIITAVLAKKMSRRKPKLVQSRHMQMTRFKNDIYHQWLYKNIDLIHSVTNKVHEQLKTFIPSSIRPQLKMIYLGVNKSNIQEEKVKLLKKKYVLHDEFVIGIVGRIEEAKGQYKLIQAVHAIADLNIKVMIVGAVMQSAYLDTLKNMIKEYQLENKIIFTGFTNDVDTHMQLFDVSILATENETFGLVVIESMVNGRMILSTKSGGPLEVIKDGVNGLFFDGSVNDLSEKLKFVYDNPDLRNNLVNNAYDTVLKFFDKKEQLNKLYKELQ